LNRKKKSKIENIQRKELKSLYCYIFEIKVIARIVINLSHKKVCLEIYVLIRNKFRNKFFSYQNLDN